MPSWPPLCPWERLAQSGTLPLQPCSCARQQHATSQVCGICQASPALGSWQGSLALVFHTACSYSILHAPMAMSVDNYRLLHAITEIA